MSIYKVSMRLLKKKGICCIFNRYWWCGRTFETTENDYKDWLLAITIGQWSKSTEDSKIARIIRFLMCDKNHAINNFLSQCMSTGKTEYFLMCS